MMTEPSPPLGALPNTRATRAARWWSWAAGACALAMLSACSGDTPDPVCRYEVTSISGARTGLPFTVRVGPAGRVEQVVDEIDVRIKGPDGHYVDGSVIHLPWWRWIDFVPAEPLTADASYTLKVHFPDPEVCKPIKHNFTPRGGPQGVDLEFGEAAIFAFMPVSWGTLYEGFLVRLEDAGSGQEAYVLPSCEVDGTPCLGAFPAGPAAFNDPYLALGAFHYPSACHHPANVEVELFRAQFETDRSFYGFLYLWSSRYATSTFCSDWPDHCRPCEHSADTCARELYVVVGGVLLPEELPPPDPAPCELPGCETMPACGG